MFSNNHPPYINRKSRVAYGFLRQNRLRELGTEFDEVLHTEAARNAAPADTPEVLALRSAQQRLLNEAP